MRKLLLLVLLCPSLAHAEWTRDVNGSARSFTLFQEAPTIDGVIGQREALLAQRLRAEVSLRGRALQLDVAWDFSPVIGRGDGDLLALATSPPLRLADLEETLAEGENYKLLQNLDRLSLRAHLPFADLVLGRQAIGLGAAQLLSPSDIFAPLSHASLDSEYRRGVDALRLTRSFAFSHEAELIAAFSDEGLDESVLMLRWHSALSALDFSLMTGSAYDATRFAADLSFDWLGAEFYADAIWRETDGGGRLRATLGAHRQLTPDLGGLLELHLSEEGGDDPIVWAELVTDPQWQRGDLFLLGRRYLAAQLSWQARPLLALSGLCLTNLDDGSALLMPSLSWDFQENAALGCGALLGTGATPSFEGLTGLPALRSEFGGMPDMFYLEFRFYL